MERGQGQTESFRRFEETHTSVFSLVRLKNHTHYTSEEIKKIKKATVLGVMEINYNHKISSVIAFAYIFNT